MTPVTLVTRDATLDDLSITDYRDMVQELRGSLSLEKLIAALGSQYSKPLWARVEKGEVPPNRNQRNELRRYYGMPLLPPTVAEATAAASPDAAVWQVGDGPAEHVIMITTPESITLHVNGAVSVATAPQPAAPERHVTEVTRARRNDRPCIRPVATPCQNSRRLALSASWRDVIDAGLATLETAVQP